MASEKWLRLCTLTPGSGSRLRVLGSGHERLIRTRVVVEEEILWFPIRGVSGELVHWIARPLPKYGDSKFVAPTGSNGSLWIPAETYAVAKHVSVPLVISEGPVKGMALIQAGARPIAPVGVWMVTVKDGESDETEEEDSNPADGARVKLHPILQHFQLAGRKVFLAFDADRRRKTHMSGMLKSAHGWLSSRPAPTCTSSARGN